MSSKNFIVVAVLCIGLFLRLFRFDEIPPSLNWDEVSLGYNAYSISQTGKDEWGRTLPLSFEAFGDFKLPVYIYSLVPFVYLLGNQDWVVRLPSLIGGALSIFLIYMIALRLTGNKGTALWASFFMAISSVPIFLSRIALEANLALGLFLGGLALFLIGTEKPQKKQIYFLPLALFLFGLTLFTYNSARIFMPLFLLSLLFIYRSVFFRNTKLWILSLIIFLAFIILAGYLAIFIDSSSRYFWVSIIDQGAINYLNEARGSSTLPDIVTKLIYNKFTYFIVYFVKNYLSHFSLSYLIFEGGKHSQFSLPNQGIVYFTEFLLFLVGFYTLIKFHLKKKIAYILLTWLLLAPIPAAITREAPHVLRAIFMMGALQIIAALGMNYLLSIKYKKVIISCIILILSLEVVIFSSKYFGEYPKTYSQSWQYGMKEAALYIKKHQNERDIYMTKKYGEPHIFYLYYTRYDPLKYQSNPTLIRYDRTYWRWVDRLDSIYFINDWDVKERTANLKKALLITTPGNFSKGNVKDSIYFLDGSKAFDIVDIGEFNEN